MSARMGGGRGGDEEEMSVERLRAAVLRVAESMRAEDGEVWRVVQERVARRQREALLPVDEFRRRRVERIWPGCPGFAHEDFLQGIREEED